VIFFLSCLIGALVYEAVFVLVNFQKGKRKSALVSRFPGSLVFGVACGASLWIREGMGESEHPFLTTILVIVSISTIGQLFLYYMQKKLNKN